MEMSYVSYRGAGVDEHCIDVLGDNNSLAS